MGWDREFPEPFLRDIVMSFIWIERVSMSDLGGAISCWPHLIDKMKNPSGVSWVGELIGSVDIFLDATCIYM